MRKAALFKRSKLLAGMVCTLLLTGCIVLPKQDLTADSELSRCLPFPNCVSTQSKNWVHHIDAIALKGKPSESWPEIIAAVNALPNTQIESQREYYLYAKARSNFFKFVDYFEVLLVEDSNTLQVRSSSMLGLSDLGVNRKRAEQFREDLEQRGIVEAPGS
jgi:uncharacterized protein (DUF1499 family)